MIALALTLVLQGAASGDVEAHVLRDARAEQARFERARRSHLPREPSAYPQSCHARVGRFCYWYDPADRDPPPEPQRIGAARERLLATIDSALRVVPTNNWLHGQRTRYLIEAGRAMDAWSYATYCTAEAFWCAALEGLSLHEAERYADADSAFARALSLMPPAERCAWIDLRDLVDGPLGREIAKADCVERERLATRLWTLAKPLWTSRGNDVRTEHLARHTMARIQAPSAIAYGTRFGDDNHELMVRYGWSEWFTQDDWRRGLTSTTSPAVTGHGREPSFSLFPRVRSLRVTPRLSPDSWDFVDSLARSRYAPRHVRELTSLPHQLARLVRGDSMELIVAYRVSDTAMLQDSLEAHIATLHEWAIRAERGDGPEGGRGILRMRTPIDTSIASIEVVGITSRHLARARYTIDPIRCARLCVSDLVLLDGATRPGVTSLDTVLAHALDDARVSVRQPLGVYWEVYSAAPSAMELSVLVTPIRIGRLRRIATQLRLAREQSPIRLRWAASPQGAPYAQTVVLRLPASARGDYRVVLTVTQAGTGAVTSAREIELVP